MMVGGLIFLVVVEAAAVVVLWRRLQDQDATVAERQAEWWKDFALGKLPAEPPAEGWTTFFERFQAEFWQRNTGRPHPPDEVTYTRTYVDADEPDEQPLNHTVTLENGAQAACSCEIGRPHTQYSSGGWL